MPMDGELARLQATSLGHVPGERTAGSEKSVGDRGSIQTQFDFWCALFFVFSVFFFYIFSYFFFPIFFPIFFPLPSTSLRAIARIP